MGNGHKQDKSQATEARREAGDRSPDDSAEVLDPEPHEPELSGDCPVEATSTELGVTVGVAWTVPPDTGRRCGLNSSRYDRIWSRARWSARRASRGSRSNRGHGRRGRSHRRAPRRWETRLIHPVEDG
ncbi:hypothetical protein JG688_00011995 [Phytophthora aleatoria]|uniref:Uncharacterized protein n=1 Tax=Phytophthora aleatoria TaxID=2496075 RepID=A0A8J5IJL5_9STRA|nr:hypothetical protein JG688_00011995 [Phytophthora aleatoria]